MSTRSRWSLLALTTLLVTALAAPPVEADVGWMSPLRLRQPSPLDRLAAAAAPQCADGISYDDGTVEDGLSFTGATFVDTVMRFDVGQSDALIEQVCVCWTRQEGSPSDLTFDLVFYDNTGPGGQPGALIDAVAVTATGIPAFPQASVFDFDISDLDIHTTTDNVYVGVSWFPENNPDVFLCTDENGGGTQPMFASGDLGATWLNLRSDAATSSIDALVVRTNFDAGGPPPVEPFDCVEDDETLCLVNDPGTDGRFQVQVDWATIQGTSGSGMAVPLTSDTGYFWFFSENNVEMVIKVLNACSFANRFWVFAGGLTNVEVDITVTDSETGQVKTYHNPQETPFQPIQDTDAFATCP